MMMHACNPNTLEVEAGASGVPGHPWLSKPGAQEVLPQKKKNEAKTGNIIHFIEHFTYHT